MVGRPSGKIGAAGRVSFGEPPGPRVMCGTSAEPVIVIDDDRPVGSPVAGTRSVARPPKEPSRTRGPSRRAIERHQSTAVAALREGEPAKIQGAVAAREPLLKSPVSGRVCVGYRITIHQGREGYAAENGVLVVSREEWPSFLVVDDTGAAVVGGPFSILLDPDDGGWADLPPSVYALLEEAKVPLSKEFSFRETLLQPGDRVSVFGRPALEIDPAGPGSFREPPRLYVFRGSDEDPVAVIDDERPDAGDRTLAPKPRLGRRRGSSDDALTRSLAGPTDELAMRALRAHERGGPEHLVEEEAAIIPPGIGDVLVRVHAASFTPTELEWPSTWVDRAGRDRRPSIPGHEVSGVVTALGYGTTGVAVGEAVYGLTDWYRDGAAAEYVAVEARNLARKPDRLDHRTAAALPMVGLTAQQALFDHGGLAPGQAVAVLGAGGGVGTFAVQLARTAGARVVALARPWATDFLRALGAEVFGDVDRCATAGGGPDLRPGRRRGAAPGVRGGQARGAAVVSVVESPPVDANRQGRFFVVEPNRSQLQALGERVVAGELRPVVGAVWPLKEGRAAFEAKHRGGQPGKAVLLVADES